MEVWGSGESLNEIDQGYAVALGDITLLEFKDIASFYNPDWASDE